MDASLSQTRERPHNRGGAPLWAGVAGAAGSLQSSYPEGSIPSPSTTDGASVAHRRQSERWFYASPSGAYSPYRPFRTSLTRSVIERNIGCTSSRWL